MNRSDSLVVHTVGSEVKVKETTLVAVLDQAHVSNTQNLLSYTSSVPWPSANLRTLDISEEVRPSATKLAAYSNAFADGRAE